MLRSIPVNSRFMFFMVVIAMLPFLCQCRHLTCESSIRSDLQVTASLGEDSTIEWAVRNVSKTPVAMIEQDLPWYTETGKVFSLLTETGHQVPRLYPLAGVMHDKVVIQPGEISHGSNSLHSWFSNVDEYRKDSHLIFFWSYWRVFDADANELKNPVKQFGYLEIPPLNTNQNQPQNNP